MFIGGCILLLASHPALAQRGAGTAAVSGVVHDAGGKPVAKALVQLQEASGKTPRAARTDAQGRFRFTRLRRGIYDVHVTAAGFESQWKRDNPLRDGQSISLTIQLSPAAKPK